MRALALLLCLISVPAFAATKTAIFAGGCFWCMQSEFDPEPGVISTRVGYTGGRAEAATYHQVSGGESGHVEAIEVTYDPAKLRYERLLTLYWENVDPTDADGQFVDRGSQYAPVIFYADGAQQRAAEISKKALAAKLKKPVVVRIAPAQPFYSAEEYHQQYYKKNAAHYKRYEQGSGRPARLKELRDEIR